MAPRAKKAVTIKSHHNVGGLPEQLGLKLLEPCATLFKDEVRELAVAWACRPRWSTATRFPGPGLGAYPGRGEERVRRPAAPRRRDLHRRAAQLTDEATGKTWYDLTSQAFTVFLPVKSVGDGRRPHLRPVVAFAPCRPVIFMTADWAELPLCAAQEGLWSHHQRGARHQSRDVRRIEQAASDD